MSASNDNAHGFATRAIHAGAEPDPATGARTTPIYQSTSFVFQDAQDAADLFALKKVGYIYSRLTNPTVSALEKRIADLEGGVGGTCTASGHSAQMLAFFALMGPGDNIVASRKLYGGSINQMKVSFPRAFGWETRFVDPDDTDSVKAQIDGRTKAIFVESLANPGGVVSDIEALATIAADAGIPLIVDNTMATPYLCRPIEWGATLVTHSTTKFLAGQGNSVGGAVVDSGTFDWAAVPGRFPALSEPDPGYHGLTFASTFGKMAFTFHAHGVGLRDLGPSQSPMNAFLTLNGIETLPLRMERHCENAKKVAEWLENHSGIAWVSQASLPSSTYHAHAQKYLGGHGGAVFTFGVKGGYAVGKKLVESTQLFSHLANIGDTRSLIIHPASTTHSQLNEDELVAAGAGPEVVRLSVGIEDAEDLIADLDQALDLASGAAAAAE